MRNPAALWREGLTISKYPIDKRKLNLRQPFRRFCFEELYFPACRKVDRIRLEIRFTPLSYLGSESYKFPEMSAHRCLMLPLLEKRCTLIGTQRELSSGDYGGISKFTLRSDNLALLFRHIPKPHINVGASKLRVLQYFHVDILSGDDECTRQRSTGILSRNVTTGPLIE